MKRLILLLFLLGSLIVEACPPPTGHLVVDVQAVWNPCEYEKIDVPSLNGTGGQFAIGFEIPKRIYSIYATGQYRYGDLWSVGILQKIDLLPLYLESPVIPEFTLNVGYDSKNLAYLRPGLEINCGGHRTFINFLIRYEVGCTFPNDKASFDQNIMAGLRFWIGKDW